jgi:hypothetical protein
MDGARVIVWAKTRFTILRRLAFASFWFETHEVDANVAHVLSVGVVVLCWFLVCVGVCGVVCVVCLLLFVCLLLGQCFGESVWCGCFRQAPLV